jgi:hypothetical protein
MSPLEGRNHNAPTIEDVLREGVQEIPNWFQTVLRLLKYLSFEERSQKIPYACLKRIINEDGQPRSIRSRLCSVIHNDCSKHK